MSDHPDIPISLGHVLHWDGDSYVSKKISPPPVDPPKLTPAEVRQGVGYTYYINRKRARTENLPPGHPLPPLIPVRPSANSRPPPMEEDFEDMPSLEDAPGTPLPSSDEESDRSVSSIYSSSSSDAATDPSASPEPPKVVRRVPSSSSSSSEDERTMETIVDAVRSPSPETFAFTALLAPQLKRRRIQTPAAQELNTPLTDESGEPITNMNSLRECWVLDWCKQDDDEALWGNMVDVMTALRCLRESDLRAKKSYSTSSIRNLLDIIMTLIQNEQLWPEEYVQMLNVFPPPAVEEALDTNYEPSENVNADASGESDIISSSEESPESETDEIRHVRRVNAVQRNQAKLESERRRIKFWADRDQ